LIHFSLSAHSEDVSLDWDKAIVETHYFSLNGLFPKVITEAKTCLLPRCGKNYHIKVVTENI
jgi:hypothetical protein